MKLRKFITILFSGTSGIFFVCGFVLPFYGFTEDERILLLGYVAIILISIAFALNVRTGSRLVSITMISMGGYAVLFGYNLFRIWSVSLAANANDPDYMTNFSGQDDFAVSIIITGSALLVLGFYSIIKRLTQTKIEKKSAI